MSSILTASNFLRKEYTTEASDIVENFVPLFISKLLAPDYELPLDSLYSVDNSYEISLKILRSLDPSYAVRLEKYWEICKESCVNRDLDTSTVIISRFLHEERQIDNGNKRYDLIEIYKFLAGAPFSKNFLEILLDEKPKISLIQNHTACKSVQTTDSGYVVNIEAQGQQVWPMSLGGLPSPREVVRTFTLTTNYAPWRDRRVRRLVKVESRAVEVWPSPFNIK